MTRSGQRTRLRRARREAAVDRVRQRRRDVSCCLSFSSCLSLSLCLCVCVYIQASLPDCDQLSFCSALIARRFVPLFWRAFLRALRRGFRVSIVRWPGQRVGDRLRVSRPGSWPPLRTRTPLPFPPPPLSSALSSSPEPQRPIFVNAMASLCSLTLSLSRSCCGVRAVDGARRQSDSAGRSWGGECFGRAAECERDIPSPTNKTPRPRLDCRLSIRSRSIRSRSQLSLI